MEIPSGVVRIFPMASRFGPTIQRRSEPGELP
jgi:hypothetical protein